MVTHTGNCRLAGFGIRRAAWSGVADGLYANGRHQYEVIIDVIKEVIGAKGEWVQAPLTDEERASVTVVEWSESIDQPLTQGWHCDETKNEFTLGLWCGKSLEADQDIEWARPVDPSLGESFKRYLRCDPDAPIGPAVFMARMVIGGCSYTTHSFSRDNKASFVCVQPVTPFELKVADLEEYIDLKAYPAMLGYHTDVFVYYWTPPQGVTFIKNLGFDVPLTLPGEGQDFSGPLSFDIPNLTAGKAGTILNKDHPGALLHLDEIHEGLPAPTKNPPVRFNERPTIMRAVRLYCSREFVDLDTRGLWCLLDNYGGERIFRLGITFEGSPHYVRLRLTDVSVPRLRMPKKFEIKLPGGEIVTDELYANGHHQCKVVIDLQVEELQADGFWLAVRLTDAERNSVTVIPYSSNVNEPLPPGWSCDNQKNIYDSGVWRRDAAEYDRNDGMEVKPKIVTDSIEVVERYLRLAPNNSNEKIRFMAAIEIGGVRYTTNYSSGDVQFNSFVTIGTTLPYPKILVSDLVGQVDHHAYSDNVCDIDVYYWIPPRGLRFVVNNGLDTPLPLQPEGLNFRSSYNFRPYMNLYRKGGVVVNRDAENSVVLLADVFFGHPQGSSIVLKVNEYPTIMRAVRARVERSLYYLNGDSKSRWRLRDNYGWEHIFRLEPDDEGNLLYLKDE